MFVDAHHTLQDSPGEPGCNLPKVIVALMFASDGTQLTAFSNAKLWPLYLAIGNELKYRQTKPSCGAFEHVAYFESVSNTPWMRVMETHSFYLVASGCLQSICSGTNWREGTQKHFYGTLSPRDVSGPMGNYP